MALLVRRIDDRDGWKAVVEKFAAHPLQAWSWGELKESTGDWKALHLVVEEDGAAVGGAQVLVRELPFPFKELAYAPRGPFSADEARLPEMAEALAAWCAENTSAVCFKIEPQAVELALSSAWQKVDTVLLDRTAVIDITPDVDSIMASIPSRKARQYIRKAGRDGVAVRPAAEEDLDTILSLYHDTAKADGFPLHVDSYYKRAFTALAPDQQVFVAEQDGEIQAFLWNVLTPGGTTFELWGAVNDAGKRSRANYLLKWTAIQAAKEAGSVLYDMNGLLNDGISDFKMLFSKDEVFWAGTFDKPLNALYGSMNLAMKARDKLLSLRNRMTMH